jgi:hypothetical protein
MDGRWEKAAQPFTEAIQAAIWCTGGRKRVPGLREYLARAGLSLSQVAEITGVPKAALVRCHTPEIFLELKRRLHLTEECYKEISALRGLIQWGQWWTTPNEIVTGKTPFEVFRANPKEFYELRHAEFVRLLLAGSEEDQITASKL